MASTRNVQFNSTSPIEEGDNAISHSPRRHMKSYPVEYSDISQEESDYVGLSPPVVLKRQTSANADPSPIKDADLVTKLSFPPEQDNIMDDKECDGIGVTDIVTRMRRLSLPESYETVAHSLATINPLLASHAERLKMRIRIVYKDKESDTKDITPQGLLIEILNSVSEFDSGTTYQSVISRRPSRGNNLHQSVSEKSKSASHSPTLPGNDAPGSHINYDKRDFIQHLRSRDIRRLETRYNMIGNGATANNEHSPYIMIRRHCVVLCLGSFIRAIIQANRFILVVQQDVGNEAMLNQLEGNIKELLRNNNNSLNTTTESQPTLEGAHAAPHLHPMRYSSQVQTPFTTGPLNSSHTPSEHSNSGPNNISAASMVSQNALAYEIQVYEALMTVVLSLLRQQYEDCSITTNEVLRAIGKNSLLSVTLQEQMRLLKDQVRELSSRCSSYCSLLSDILQSEDDDEYSFLYLSELSKEPKVYDLPICEGSKILFSRCSDIETIFDSLLMDFEGLEKGSQSLLKKLESAEISVGLRLDASRNQLLVATTIISIISSTIAFAGFITGAFGMNLDNSAKFEAVDGFFACVVVACVLFIVISSTAIIIYFEDEGWIPQHDYFNFIRSIGRRNLLGFRWSRRGSNATTHSQFSTYNPMQ